MQQYKVYRESWAANSREEEILEFNSLREAEDYAQNWAYEDIEFGIEADHGDGTFTIFRTDWYGDTQEDKAADDNYTFEEAMDYAKEWTYQDISWGARRVKNAKV